MDNPHLLISGCWCWVAAFNIQIILVENNFSNNYTTNENKKRKVMTRINNLFALYIIACFGYGAAYIYWDKTKASYVFLAIGLVLILLLVASRYYHSKEAHEFFRKHDFRINLLSFLCLSMGMKDNLMASALREGLYSASIFSLTIWFITIFGQRDVIPERVEDDEDDDDEIDNSPNIGGRTTLAWWI